MTTATAPHVDVRRVAASAWVTAALSQPVGVEDLVDELAGALEDEILEHPEMVEVQEKVNAGLKRLAAADEALADEINFDDLILFDFYCATVHATLAAVLARSEAVPA